jgi:hypothetical protein
MGINFPNAPTLNQLWPQPPVVGQPVYIWDGQKWTTQGANSTFGAVRYDVAQALTLPQQVQGRQNIYAAPFDAMAYNGMQVNGAMEIAQTYQFAILGNPTNGTNQFVADQWSVGRTSSFGMNCDWSGDAPPGFASSIVITITSAAALAAGDYVGVRTIIEQFRVRRLQFGLGSAQPFTIGFYAKAHRPGLYGGAVKDNSATRSYPFTYTINAADTWEYKTVTIPGDIAGANWSPASNVGALQLWFAVATGSTFTAAAGSWTSGNFLSATGAINGAQAATDKFLITGVNIFPGIEAPTVDRVPFIQRAQADELALCKRYFQKIMGTTDFLTMYGYNIATATPQVTFTLPVELRNVPIATIQGSWSASNCSGLTFTGAGIKMFSLNTTVTATGAFVISNTNSGAGLTLDARM